MKYDVYMAEWYSNSINVKQHQTSRSTIYISTVHIYMHHIISCCIHYECKHEKQVFPCTTWTLKSLYNAGHKLKHFWSQIVPGHKLKHFVVTNRAAVTNWSESQIVPSHVWRHDLWLASICDCGTICDRKMLQFVTRHDLWPKVLQFVTSVIQWF